MTLVAASLAWSLFAFAGRETWTLVPLLAALVVACILVRPQIARPPFTLVDTALGAVLAACSAQLVPMPAEWREALSPHAAIVDRTLRLDVAAAATAGARAAARPLSIHPAHTAAAVTIAVAAVLMFWIVRSALASGGLRRLTARIAWVGLAFAVLALIQRAMSPTRMYGVWSVPGDNPFGPFVNRNHAATWLMMGALLTVGHLLMRVRIRSLESAPAADTIARVVEDSTTWWLGAAAALMFAALLTSLSRSGFLGLACGALAGAAMMMPKLRRRDRWRLWLVPVAAAAIALGYANPGRLLARFESAHTRELGGRVEIWRQTVLILRDFPLTGTGAGTFGAAMLVYQQGDRQFFFNTAHNQYLQIAAEGGVLVVAPSLLALFAYGVVAMRRIRADRSPAAWLRAGALSALLAVGVQSLWETGLVMPANAMLFAAIAAMGIHDIPAKRPGPTGRT